MKKILVLEDEANIRSFVVINLNRAGYETIEAGTGEEALEQLRLNPDVRVALLDIMLPDMDGFEVCRRIRAGNSKIGIIMLTARTQEMDKVTGFMTGADDYVTKPFSPAELTARIDALYRRIGGDMMDDGEIQQPPFVLNTRKRTLEKNGQRIKLTQVEYAIMKMFMENPGKALSREEILKFVWGENYLGELKIVDVNIRRLRVKIEDEPTSPAFITTIWGYGYKWEFEEQSGRKGESHDSIPEGEGIRQRWLLNSISILVMILVVVVAAFSLIIKNYYDSSILTDMESKARMAASYFSTEASSYNYNSSGDYLTAAQDYVSSFEDGTRIELQFLNPGGKVIYSSNGLTLSGTMAGTRGHHPGAELPGGGHLEGGLQPDRASRITASPPRCCTRGSWWGSCAMSPPCGWWTARCW